MQSTASGVSTAPGKKRTRTKCDAPGDRLEVEILALQMKRLSSVSIAMALLPMSRSAQITDYHQHLFSPEAGARSSPGPKGINATDLITELDASGIQRAVVLSVAYTFANPNKPPVPDEYAHVK